MNLERKKGSALTKRKALAFIFIVQEPSHDVLSQPHVMTRMLNDDS
jgi:hypothetical protein